jgi:hypothetical protein
VGLIASRDARHGELTFTDLAAAKTALVRIHESRYMPWGGCCAARACSRVSSFQFES